MEAQVSLLAEQLLEQLKSSSSINQRILIGIGGIPGSGKSSLAKHLVDRINTISEPHDQAVMVGMDGWHYTRQELSLFKDPKYAFDHRGAEFTFDSLRFAKFVTSLKQNPNQTIKAPSFDHDKKDPIQDDILILPHHRIVIIEGLYCNCNVGNWEKAAKVFDHRWISTISRQEARKRLILRHVLTGVAKDNQEAEWRAENNDLPNGDWLLSNLLEPYTVIDSQHDTRWESTVEC